MQPGTASRLVAACLALAAFAVSIIAGLAVDNPADVILTRALICMLGGLVVGLIAGTLAERVVQEQIAKLVGGEDSSSSRAALAPGAVSPSALTESSHTSSSHRRSGT